MAAPTWRERLEDLFERYGWTAFGTYWVLYAITWGTIYALIKSGFEFESAAGEVGAVATTWAVNKTIQIPRILVAIAIAPRVASMLEWLRGVRPADAAPTPDTPTSTDSPSPE